MARNLRGHWPSTIVFGTYADIIDAACATRPCETWNKLATLPGVITPAGLCAWARIGKCEGLLASARQRHADDDRWRR